MVLRITPYTPEHVYEVTQFNKRLRQGGVRFQFPEHHIPRWLPRHEGRSIFQEFFLVIEDDQAVRGGYILKHQQFQLGEKTLNIANYQLPISEHTVSPAYAGIGLQVLADALRRQPLLYALGMGGMDRALPQILSKLGWRLLPIPFYFRVCHPRSFLRNLNLFRERPAWRLLSDIAAATGVGAAGILSLQASRKKKRSRLGRMDVEAVPRFNQWASDLWNEYGHQYSFCAVRNLPVLNILYPDNNKRFHRLLVRADGAPVGWAVVLDTHMKDHKQFGDMRVGTIADCFAAPDQADTVVAAATEFLEDRGVDLVISNQAHPWWCSALANSGFLSGPSNFIFAISQALTRELNTADQTFERVHLNRGDGDGPIHL